MQASPTRSPRIHSHQGECKQVDSLFILHISTRLLTLCFIQSLSLTFLKIFQPFFSAYILIVFALPSQTMKEENQEVMSLIF